MATDKEVMGLRQKENNNPN